VAVARLGNFTRAAERLNLSQPSLSLHIRQLEQDLGVRLLDRSTRSVALTRAGEDFLPTAERLLDDFQSAVASVADLAARRRGRVAVAVLPSVAAELLPRAIALLRARHPDVGVALRDDVAEHIPARVRNGEVDFGLGAIDTIDADLAGVPLLADELIAVVPRPHPLTRLAKVTWRALAGYPFVAMSRDSSVRRLTDMAFARSGLPLEPAFEAKYMSTAIGIVANGLGVGALPSSAIAGRSIARRNSGAGDEAADRDHDQARPLAVACRAGVGGGAQERGRGRSADDGARIGIVHSALIPPLRIIGAHLRTSAAT
jgi:DNA-binding transcriptional LysR family regulator